MREREHAGTSEMKAFGQELLDLGARYVKAGKAWLNHRRHEMNHEHGHKGNYRHDGHQEQSRGQSRNAQSGRAQDGRYQGSDYEDPRAGSDRDFGAGRQWDQQDAMPEQRYAGYSESGGYRAQSRQWNEGGQGGYEDDFQPMSAQGQNTGGYGGYADQQGGRGQGSYGSRRYAQDQYGDPRGQGGSAQGSDNPSSYGRPSQSGYGQGNRNPSGQGGYGQGYGQGGGSDHGQGSRYGQGSSYGQAGQAGQGSYAQGSYGHSGQDASQGGDRESMGGHRGKGPRNYSRSDERLAEDINEQLMHSDDIDASDIDVKVEGGEVKLEGTVTERWMKHQVEDLVERCSGVKDIDNRIRVKKSWSRGMDEDSSSDMKSSSSNGNGVSGSAGSVSGSSGTGTGRSSGKSTTTTT